MICGNTDIKKDVVLTFSWNFYQQSVSPVNIETEAGIVSLNRFIVVIERQILSSSKSQANVQLVLQYINPALI